MRIKTMAIAGAFALLASPALAQTPHFATEVVANPCERGDYGEFGFSVAGSMFAAHSMFGYDAACLSQFGSVEEGQQVVIIGLLTRERTRFVIERGVLIQDWNDSLESEVMAAVSARVERYIRQGNTLTEALGLEVRNTRYYERR